MIGVPYALELLLVVAAIAAVTDQRATRIPNWLTVPTVALALAAHGVLGGLPGLALSLLGVLVVGLVPLLLHARGLMGAGDVKLFVAVGALLGPGRGLEIELISLLIAAIWALGVLAHRGVLFRTLGNLGLLALTPVLPEDRRVTSSAELTREARIGVAVLLGAVVSLLAGPLGGIA